MPNSKLNLKPIVSPPKKEAKTHSRTSIAEVKDDEERTCSKKIGKGVGKKEEITTRQVSFEEEPGLNIDHVIDTIITYVFVHLVKKVVGGIEVEVLIEE
jgi:hypothetical protein